jgi:hypothetical protein
MDQSTDRITMATTRRIASAARSAIDESSPAAGSVATPDAGLGASQGDYAQFIWQKLDAIDGRMADLAEKYGRFDSRLDTMQESHEKLDGKISGVDDKLTKIEKIVVRASGIVAGIVIICGVLSWLWSQVKDHITIH